MEFATTYLSAGGIITVGFGVAYLLRSHAMARMVEIQLPSPPARADYRAIYGGSQVGIGLFFCLAAWQHSWRVSGLVALGLFALGFGITRLSSLAYERAGRNWQWIVGILETVAGAIALVAAVRN